MKYENTFVREVKEKNITEPSEILNWYRNLYHTEDNHTEHGIVAYAINDFFADVVPKSEVKRLEKDNEDLRNVLTNTINKYRNCEADVAREIFALIYDRLLTSFPAQSFIDAPCTTHDRLFDMLDELKKKYTEGDQ